MSFDHILQRAIARKGGFDELASQLPHPVTSLALSQLTDDRYLAEMTKRIFQAGFVWRVVENKWPGFEEAFQGFDPLRFAALPEDALRPLASDTRIIRNWQKIRTVKVNAEMVVALAEQHGSFARFVADWPATEIVDLWQLFKKRGARLGGMTGPMFLRHLGKDTFILTQDVVAALVREGVVRKTPTSMKDLKAVQSAFNQWHRDTEYPMCQLSKILACSVD